MATPRYVYNLGDAPNTRENHRFDNHDHVVICLAPTNYNLFQSICFYMILSNYNFMK